MWNTELSDKEISLILKPVIFELVCMQLKNRVFYDEWLEGSYRQDWMNLFSTIDATSKSNSMPIARTPHTEPPSVADQITWPCAPHAPGGDGVMVATSDLHQ